MAIFSFLSAILLHESGHMFALLLYRAKIINVRLSPFGMTITHSALPSEIATFTVAAFGPLFGIIGFFAEQCSGTLPFFSLFSLVLSLFNLLPIKTLDGSRMTEALLSRFLPPNTATCVAELLSHIFLFLLWLFGIFLFFFLDESPSLFFMSLALFFQGVKDEESLKIE